MNTETIEQLTNHQRQLDFDGIEVAVSRQALNELLDAIAESDLERLNNLAMIETLKERLKSEEEASRSFRGTLHDIAECFFVPITLHPAGILRRFIQLKDDKDEIENMWSELTESIGAQGPDSDPLTGTDTTEQIQDRALNLVSKMKADVNHWRNAHSELFMKENPIVHPPHTAPDDRKILGFFEDFGWYPAAWSEDDSVWKAAKCKGIKGSKVEEPEWHETTFQEEELCWWREWPSNSIEDNPTPLEMDKKGKTK